MVEPSEPMLPERVSMDYAVTLRAEAQRVVEWAASADDLSAVRVNWMRAGALEKLVDDRETERELARSRRWLEVACGRLLGLDVEQGDRTDLTVNRDRQLTRQDSHQFRQLARWTIGEHQHPEIIGLVDRGAGRSQILRRIAELTPVESGNGSLPGWSEPDRFAIVHADFREYCKQIPDGVVDMIVTDPPYPKEHIPLFGDLAEMAARVLSPRGLLFCVTGKISLPLVIEQLGEHLTYGWVFCLDLPGVNSRIMGRHITQAWKPILVYSTGTWPAGEWGSDRVTSPAKAQDEFAWAQNAEPIRELIQRYTRPNALVLDPMCGGGSYGAAALLEGRRFVGVDGHADPVAIATRRLEELA